MSMHWLHIALSWGFTLGAFAALGLAAGLRVRAAKRALARLESRAQPR